MSPSSSECLDLRDEEMSYLEELNGFEMRRIQSLISRDFNRLIQMVEDVEKLARMLVFLYLDLKRKCIIQ